MILFDSVTKTYSANNKKPATLSAVQDFSYRFKEGKTTCLVGSSGCGKSTLLRLINRMEEPTSGRIIVRGEDIAQGDPVQLRRSIGYVMQQGGLMPHRTVAHNISMVAQLQNKTTDVARYMQLLDLDPALADRYPAELSGGQAQRVGVARALAAEPDILLMDEPFGAVDPVVRRELQTMMLRLQQNLAKTIILVTHDIDEAFRLGDEVVLLSVGAKIEQAGTPEELITVPANEFVAQFVGLDDRKLHVASHNNKEVIVDAHGRVRGVLGS
ncbi:MAG: ATP-binding cassette domain-containing protein [Corynebacterium sp.]|uniref:ABC transporter ATP-binding protein n=1 Tax=Corynebacterium sp. TaxID=1720 RepID=UPI0026DDAF4C|nr:ATP-binding cassette domain-containing protein [Corynebacterium sp.]MDO5097908.1 ATP-binding cassette domain-containing protein [Corynebacterium sp.]